MDGEGLRHYELRIAGEEVPTCHCQDLLDLISTLSLEQQKAVAEFVHILKKEQEPRIATFHTALDEFVREHPELTAADCS